MTTYLDRKPLTCLFNTWRGAVLINSWDTGVGGLAFTSQFLQIATRLPSSKVYGFGENLHYQFQHNMSFRTWPLWARDQPPFSGDESQVRARMQNTQSALYAHVQNTVKPVNTTLHALVQGAG